MEMPKLTQEESETYIRIVKVGNMDDMFNFGFLLGKRQAIRESLDILNNTTNNE